MYCGLDVGSGYFFFFKQNMAYEMRISDWSSDVGSSDLITYDELNRALPQDEMSSEQIEDIMTMLSELGVNVVDGDEVEEGAAEESETEIGRASCRERVCQYV